MFLYSTAKRKQQRIKRKHMAVKFDKLFTENKQLFDMNCDCCPTKFETLDDARKHYKEFHNEVKYTHLESVSLLLNTSIFVFFFCLDDGLH